MKNSSAHHRPAPSPPIPRGAGDGVLIFGGTFDPPHAAHVQLPLLAAREIGCARIIYVPAAINPLKIAADAPPPTPAHHRLKMLELALRERPRGIDMNIDISTIELDRPGPSYTIDTLRALAGSLEAQASGGRKPGLFLLIGADQALEFHRWKEWQSILELAQPAVMLRPPWKRESFAAALRERYGESEAQRWMQWTLATLPLLDVSATEIRRRARAGDAADSLLPESVRRYIARHALYR